MSNVIFISTEALRLRAELNDTPTAQAIYDALPIEGLGNRWGEEVYFEIPVDEPLASDATEEVQVGELGYWPPGKAFCIFFGRTPASAGDDPRAASPVNRIGMVMDDATVLTDVPHGAEVRLEKA
jgi:hypothetical protein